MTIPSKQLNRWTKHKTAAINGAKETHEHIRDTLEDSNSILNSRDITFDTKLQGSYNNHTIIRESSDVDILVRMKRPFHSDKSNLTDSDVDRYYQPGHYKKRDDYSYDDFRIDVVSELRDNYGADSVTDGNKAIEIESSKLLLSADVVPCQEYRYYTQYTGYDSDKDYIEGVVFWTSNNEKIRNYPEQHEINATDKHQNTNNRFKPTVRMFKNARNKMVDKDIIESKDVAPSYFIECLVWNADEDILNQGDLQVRYGTLIENLGKKDFNNFRHVHNLVDLFGNSKTRWSTDKAETFLLGLITLWEEW